MAHINSHLPFDLDVRDPTFADQMFQWASQTQLEIRKIISASDKMIATSKALIAEADRLGGVRISGTTKICGI